MPNFKIIYIYIYVCMCVCLCMCVYVFEREIKRMRVFIYYLPYQSTFQEFECLLIAGGQVKQGTL